MPLWEIRIHRLAEQTRGSRTRTIGAYQVYRDGVAATESLLYGTSAEALGPGGNDISAKDKRRIAAGTYKLRTTSGPDYLTHGYRQDNLMRPEMPGIELVATESRSDILIHPGKNAFLSSVGCINLCTRLPTPDERIDYVGSRQRVIALIEDMKHFLGAAFPPKNGRLIPGASVAIAGEP
ncbi:MAG TPA: DUF5675 family protein [Allosphingosinicella sp.]|jgi:hypothetical protein